MAVSKEQVNIVARIVIWAILIVCGLIVLIPLVVWLSGLFKGKGDTSFSHPEGRAKLVHADKSLMNQSNLTDEQAMKIANDLQWAMGDSENDPVWITESLSGLNAADFEKVYYAFGLRYHTVDVFTGEGGTPAFGPGMDDLWDLTQWLRSEVKDELYFYEYLDKVFSGSTPYPGDIQMMPARDYVKVFYPYLGQ